MTSPQCSHTLDLRGADKAQEKKEEIYDNKKHKIRVSQENLVHIDAESCGSMMKLL